MKEDYNGFIRPGSYDAAYYWEQFQPIIAAVGILLVGWVIALLIAAGIKKILAKLNTDQNLSRATGHHSNIENIICNRKPLPEKRCLLTEFQFLLICSVHFSRCK